MSRSLSLLCAAGSIPNLLLPSVVFPPSLPFSQRTPTPTPTPIAIRRPTNQPQPPPNFIKSQPQKTGNRQKRVRFLCLSFHSIAANSYVLGTGVCTSSTTCQVRCSLACSPGVGGEKSKLSPVFRALFFEGAAGGIHHHTTYAAATAPNASSARQTSQCGGQSDQDPGR